MKFIAFFFCLLQVCAAHTSPVLRGFVGNIPSNHDASSVMCVCNEMGKCKNQKVDSGELVAASATATVVLEGKCAHARITICHEGKTTLEVGAPALWAHISKHHDTIGACPLDHVKLTGHAVQPRSRTSLRNRHRVSDTQPFTRISPAMTTGLEGVKESLTA
jgi:hypothetical protein